MFDFPLAEVDITWFTQMCSSYYLGLDDLPYLILSNNMAWRVTNMSFVCRYFPFSANIN